MEAHPVPQNVTSFQFRLVGDMTLKQFGYLASGMAIAYLVFIILASSFPLLAWPIIVISSILGIAFAFIPIANRPLDHWTSAFLKAIYSPTQRSWQKNGEKYNQSVIFAHRLSVFLPTLTPQINIAPITPEPKLEPSPPPPEPPKIEEKLPTKEELTKTVQLAKEAQELQVKTIEAERTLTQIKGMAQAPGVDPKAYTEQFNTTFEKLQKLVEEASEIRRQLQALTKVPQIQVPKVKVKVPIAPKPRQTQIVLTTFPNVINGIVLDANGNYLEGVVVVIHDKDGLPVRALKTNKLGQFTGSTPLPNGTYTVELEKDELIFDVLQLELSGKVLPPLSVSAKKLAGSS